MSGHLDSLARALADPLAVRSLDLYLDWRDRGLGALPASVGALRNLEVLTCECLDVPRIPPEVVALPRLRRLRLTGLGGRVLPPELGALHRLEALELDDNELTTLPDLRGLTGLTELSLRNNQLGTLPPWLAALPGLTRLDLDGNPLAEVPDLRGCAALRELVIVGDEHLPRVDLSRLPAALSELTIAGDRVHGAASPLPALRILELRVREPDGLAALLPRLHGLEQLRLEVLPAQHQTGALRDGAALGSLPPSLEQLQLRRAGLDRIPASVLALPRLRRLDLHGNHIREVPSAITRLPLEALNLSRNPLVELAALPATLTSLALSWISGLPALPAGLRALDLDGCRFEALPPLGDLRELEELSARRVGLLHWPDGLARLPRLRTLHLDGNRLATVPASIDQLVALRVLGLSHNQLTSLPDALGAMALERLDLDGTHLRGRPPALVALRGRARLSLAGGPMADDDRRYLEAR